MPAPSASAEASVTLVLGVLEPADRAAVEGVLRATGAFREPEVAVALELFDDAFTAGGGAGRDPEQYAFTGAFAPAGTRELVGYACWGRTPETRGTYDLYWLAVHPDAQGSGVGSALVADVWERVAAIGGRLLVIEASGRADNAPVRGFYERLCGPPAARVRDFYAAGDDRLTYTMRIHRAATSHGSKPA